MNPGLVWNSQELASHFWPLGRTADHADDNQPVQKGKSCRNFWMEGRWQKKSTQVRMKIPLLCCTVITVVWSCDDCCTPAFLISFTSLWAKFDQLMTSVGGRIRGGEKLRPSRHHCSPLAALTSSWRLCCSYSFQWDGWHSSNNCCLIRLCQCWKEKKVASFFKATNLNKS